MLRLCGLVQKISSCYHRTLRSSSSDVLKASGTFNIMKYLLITLGNQASKQARFNFNRSSVSPFWDTLYFYWREWIKSFSRTKYSTPEGLSFLTKPFYTHVRTLWLDAVVSNALFVYPVKHHSNCFEVRYLQICLDSLESSSTIPDVLSSAVKGSQAPRPTSLALLTHRSAATFLSKAKGFGRPFLQSLSQENVSDISLLFFMNAIVHFGVFWVVTLCTLLR